MERATVSFPIALTLRQTYKQDRASRRDNHVECLLLLLLLLGILFFFFRFPSLFIHFFFWKSKREKLFRQLCEFVVKRCFTCESIKKWGEIVEDPSSEAYLMRQDLASRSNSIVMDLLWYVRAGGGRMNILRTIYTYLLLLLLLERKSRLCIQYVTLVHGEVLAVEF